MVPYTSRMSMVRTALLGSLHLGLAGLCSYACAHPEAETLRVDNDWIRPRIEDTARSALRCIRSEPDRVIEFEAFADGKVRAFVEPSPAVAAESRCATEEADHLKLGATVGGLRVIIAGNGSFLDPQSARARGLALRARAVSQITAIESCRADLQKRNPGASGRIGIALTVGNSVGNPVAKSDATTSASAVTAEVAATTLDETTSACVKEAARKITLPTIPGSYRFSYFLAAQGVLVGAPDVDPLDPSDLGLALSDIRPRTDACVKGYRTPGQVLLRFTLGNDGAPISVGLERTTEGSLQTPEDMDADACMKKAAALLRVLPFDGPPVATTVPIILR